MNDIVFSFFGVNDFWKKVTDVLLIAAFAVLAIFAITGLVQLIKRKSLKKVDPEITAMIPSLVLVAVIYVIFEKVCILNYRPILIDGVAESSFPSTHTLVAVTIFGMTMLALSEYVKNKTTRVILKIVLIALMGVTAFGRVASGMHWLTDVLGGIVFGADLVLIYGIILRFIKEHRKNG